ncbi:hypothetical protein MMC07_005326 [Pseudocyphellaria aurata]|nr:hypothetical protein [Pseudocyphellaria aurata]
MGTQRLFRLRRLSLTENLYSTSFTGLHGLQSIKIPSAAATFSALISIMKTSTDLHMTREVPYIPKLQYKTRSFDPPERADSSSPLVSTSFSMGTESSALTLPKSPGRDSSLSFQEVPLKRASSLHARFSIVSSSCPSPAPQEKIPKKRGGLFGFLSVKEPSRQAFDHYQRQMCEKSASNNGRPGAVGVRGVSSAKLPPGVPKVNTKWDGIPQAVRGKANVKQTRPAR